MPRPYMALRDLRVLRTALWLPLAFAVCRGGTCPARPRVRTPYSSVNDATTISSTVITRHSTGAPTTSASLKPRLRREPPAK